MVHAADTLANMSQIGALFEESHGGNCIDTMLWERLSIPLGDAQIDEILGQAGHEFADTVTLLTTNS